MIEINNSKINIDDIKARIREEAARHLKMNDFIEEETENGSFPDQTRTFHTGPYHCSDFLKFHGRDFINKAYRALLHREPDTKGAAFYLEKLTGADLTRVDILGRLRYSKEGRRKKVPVKGLLFPFLIQTGFKIPFLGRALRVSAAVLNLPVILKNFQRMDFAVAEQNQALSHAKSEIETLKKTVLYYRMAWETETAEKKRQLAGLKAEMVTIEKDLNTWSDKTSEQAATFQIQLLDMERKLQIILEEIRKELSEPSPRLETVLGEEGHLFDALYLGFEDRFRGPESSIREQAGIYLPHVKSALNRTGGGSLLDVGCGRGEWLGLLKDHHIPAAGVDLNRVMVDKCRKAGLDVTVSDAIACLRSLQNESLAVITGFHVVEHLPFNTLISLFDESLRVLKPGGMVIFETPNPENLMVGAFTFYLDPTHKNPIPPETLSYLVKARGFERTEILRLHPNPWLTFDNPLLNQLLAVEQDYSVLGFKA